MTDASPTPLSPSTATTTRGWRSPIHRRGAGGGETSSGDVFGFGERCGNANLSTIICNLQLKRGYECIPPDKLKDIYERGGDRGHRKQAIPANQPYVGMNAFAHKAGMHADGVLKYSSSFEHIDPEAIGNRESSCSPRSRERARSTTN